MEKNSIPPHWVYQWRINSLAGRRMHIINTTKHQNMIVTKDNRTTAVAIMCNDPNGTKYSSHKVIFCSWWFCFCLFEIVCKYRGLQLIINYTRLYKLCEIFRLPNCVGNSEFTKLKFQFSICRDALLYVMFLSQIVMA